MAKSRGGKAFYRVTSNQYIPFDKRRTPIRHTSDWKTEGSAIWEANKLTRQGHEEVRIRKYVEVPYDDNRITKSDEVFMFQISPNNDNWYYVFARSTAEAVNILISTHFPKMTDRDFSLKYKPALRRVPDREKILVNDEDVGQQSWTAKRWAKGRKPGMFCSNTYES